MGLRGFEPRLAGFFTGMCNASALHQFMLEPAALPD